MCFILRTLGCVDYFDGLLVNYCRKMNVDIILRGMRAMTDFEREFPDSAS